MRALPPTRQPGALAPSPGLARLLAVLSAIVTMVFLGPVLVGFGIAIADSPGEDHSFELMIVFWALIAWPVASATAVGCAVIMRRWPRLAACLLVLVAAAMGFPFVVNGLIALAAALFSYLDSRALEPPAPARAVQQGGMSDTSVRQERAEPLLVRAAVIGVAAVVGIIVLVMAVPTLFGSLGGDSSGSTPLPTEALGQSAFTTPEDAIRDYAERIAPPFLGDCGSAAADKGACVDASGVSGDEATYTLCFRQKGTCVVLELHRKGDVWAVVSEREAKPEEGVP
jgi:hypothetical protein